MLGVGRGEEIVALVVELIGVGFAVVGLDPGVGGVAVQIVAAGAKQVLPGTTEQLNLPCRRSRFCRYRTLVAIHHRPNIATEEGVEIVAAIGVAIDQTEFHIVVRTNAALKQRGADAQTIVLAVTAPGALPDDQPSC